VPARKIGGSGKKVEVQMKDGTRATVAETDLKKLNRASLKRVVADLTLLDDMVPPLILHNLKERFARKEIYTNVGTILISVNPYQSLDLYTDDVVKKYVTKAMGKEMPPHTYVFSSRPTHHCLYTGQAARV
jgi:myosin-1